MKDKKYKVDSILGFVVERRNEIHKIGITRVIAKSY